MDNLCYFLQQHFKTDLDLERKYRATATGDLREKGNKSPEWQVVKVAMKLKMIMKNWCMMNY